MALSIPTYTRGHGPGQPTSCHACSAWPLSLEVLPCARSVICPSTSIVSSKTPHERNSSSMPSGGGRSFVRVRMRLFAARTTKLTWSRALLKLVVAELFPDDLFSELVGNLDRVPRRQWPHVIAIAVALRHSWRRDGLARIARGLRISLTTTPVARTIATTSHPTITDTDSPARLGPVKALRFAPTPRSGARGLDRRTRSSHGPASYVMVGQF